MGSRVSIGALIVVLGLLFLDHLRKCPNSSVYRVQSCNDMAHPLKKRTGNLGNTEFLATLSSFKGIVFKTES